jgi:hypothetical protein
MLETPFDCTVEKATPLAPAVGATAICWVRQFDVIRF